MEAIEGQSVSVKLNVDSDPCWGEVSNHTLMKEGSEAMTKAYKLTRDEITFHEVIVEDSGTYIISCCNEVGEGSARFQLDIKPASDSCECLNEN